MPERPGSGGAPAVSRPPAGRAAPGVDAANPCCGRQCVDLGEDVAEEHVDVREQFRARDQTPVEAVEIALHGDVESLALDDRRDRVVVLEPRAGGVERRARTGHVGDDQVARRQPRPEAQPGASRIARAKTAGGGNSAKSVSRSAGSAEKISLLLDIESCTRRTRRRGSGSSVGRTAESIDTRLVQRSVSSPVRTETGTRATSGSAGSAPRRSRKVRSPPVQAAMTTSLRVTPNADFTCLTTSSDVDRMASFRCGVMGPLNGVRGGRTLGTAGGASGSSGR